MQDTSLYSFFKERLSKDEKNGLDSHAKKAKHSFWRNLLEAFFANLVYFKPQGRELFGLILDSHPFSEELKAQGFGFHKFTSEKSLKYSFYYGMIRAFLKKWKQIFTSSNTAQKRLQFKDLLQKCEDAMSFEEPKLKYDCAFLMSVNLGYLKAHVDPKGKSGRRPDLHVQNVAEKIYEAMHLVSPEKAEGILGGLLPQVYSEIPDHSKEDYSQVTAIYSESGLEPQIATLERAGK